MKSLAIDWTKTIKDAEKKREFEALLRNSRTVLSRLYEIIEDKERQADKLRSTDYDSPSWAYKTADNNGYRRCLQELRQLLSFLE